VVFNYFLASKNALENGNWKSKKFTIISKRKKSRKSPPAILNPTEHKIAKKRLLMEVSKNNNLSVDTELLAKHIVRKSDKKTPVIVNEGRRISSTKTIDALGDCADIEVIHKTSSVERFVTVQQKHKCNN
jgi:hypothetical protein